MSNSPVERLYLVFVHYALKTPGDWKWLDYRLEVDYDVVVPRLASDLCYLRQILKPRSANDGQLWKGFAFVFLDPGWTNLLTGGIPLDMAMLGSELSRRQIEIETRLMQNDDLRSTSEPKRERIITAGDLLYLLGVLDRASQSRGESFYKLFYGGSQTLRYDAPKVIEAAIRIANMGCGVPLFRFDDDVIFYGRRSPEIRTTKERESAADDAAKNVMRLCERYEQTLRNPQIRYFVYSGGYCAPQGELENCKDNDPSLLNGFATRVLQLTQLPKKRNSDKEDTIGGCIKATVVNTFMKEIVQLGSNPFRQVVSGAGLCLSDGAILDLPPYSNMHLNVMWIDDHLKYALHDELGHFGRWTRSHHHYEARVKEARFAQLRHAPRVGQPLFTYKDVKWHLKTYMLRLILGCVADAWLRQKPELKRSTRGLNKDDYRELVRSVPCIYAEEFMKVVPSGWDATGQRVHQFKEKLWQRGCERLKEAVKCWSSEIYKSTFLGLFVYGPSHDRYDEFCDVFASGISEGLANAVNQLPANYREAEQLQQGVQFDDPSLAQALVILVDDFVDYLKLVQFWPFFVQSVRCFQNQYAQYHREDFEWMFPTEEKWPGPPKLV